MSIDAEVWVHRPGEARVALFAASNDWHVEADGGLLLEPTDGGWQLSASAPEEEDPSCAEASLAGSIGNRQHVIYLTLEGDFDDGGPAFARSLRLLAERCGGVTLDPDSGELLVHP